MKKSLFSLALVAALAFACQKPAPTPEPEPEAPAKPKVIEELVDVTPEGGEATLDIKAESTWKVKALDEYDWISVSPTSGEGNATLKFTVASNETDREKSAEFTVTENFGEGYDYKTYSILVTQAKKESNYAEGDLAFLKAIVAGKMFGDKTPEVDNWFVIDETFPGIGVEETDGKFSITTIGFDREAPLCDFPEEMNLLKLQKISMRDNVALTGKKLPKVWNTPELFDLGMANCGLTGTIPEGFAKTPKLTQVFLDGNNFYGALPHIWESKVLEVFILANSNNRGVTSQGVEEELQNQNSGLGYMVPATLDVILNTQKTYQNDKTQMKLGGVRSLNWIGFEKGWGQARYEAYDKDAVKGDTTTWSIYRLLAGPDGDEGWAWFYSNLGYPEMAMDIPTVMLDWDQAAADAFTAKMEAKYGSTK